MKTLFTVTTPDGAPVDAALLEATSPCGNWQAVTDARGEFEADLGAGPYSVTATKDGITTDPVSTFVGPVPIVFQAGGGTVPPVNGGADAIDLAAAVITASSPDVRGWPIGARLASLFLDFEVNANVWFDKIEGPGAWPFVMGPEGEIQYTLWVGCQIAGVWYFCGAILCIKRPGFDNYVPTGPTLQPGQLPKNWYYYAGAPLATYQPQPGELVAWFLTAGVQRRNEIHAVRERTQVVLAPFSPGTFEF